MIRKLGVLVAALAAFAFVSQSAEAAGKRRDIDPGIAATAVGVGAASTLTFLSLNDWKWDWNSGKYGLTSGGAYVGTTIGCAALSPIVATIALKRQLKYREAHILFGSCVIPIIGGLLVNEAYNAGLLTAPDEAAPVAKRGKRRAKK